MIGNGKSGFFGGLGSRSAADIKWGDIFHNHTRQPQKELSVHTCPNCNSCFTTLQLQVNEMKCLRCKKSMTV